MSAQYIDGGITNYVWQPRLIRLTSAQASSFEEDTDIFIDPAKITFIRRIGSSEENKMPEAVTYIYLGNTGVYVKEQPAEVNKRRNAAMNDLKDDVTHMKIVE